MAIRMLLVAGLMMIVPANALAQDSAAPSLKGDLVIQWSDEKRFIYVVSPRPLVFTKGGREIKPGRMYTDGGSIPRLFWSVKGFSPWGYAPAYIIHDWLFHRRRCNQDGAPNTYTLAEANQILEDTIQILFESGKVDRNDTARRLIKWAVDQYGQSAWTAPCDPPPPVIPSFGPRVVITVEHLSFGE